MPIFAYAFRLDSRSGWFQSVVMFELRRCAAVIPCFNESATIALLVAALKQHLPLVIVVDDGSTDDAGNLARNAGATVVLHESNRGKGASLNTGLSRALEAGCEWAVTLDGDGQHAPEDLPLLFQCATETGAALVIGNRMHDAAKMRWLRRQVNRFMSWQLSQRTGHRLPDSQCGLRLIHLPTWTKMALKSQRFEVESEILVAFLAAGQRVEFVPVQVIPAARKSHIRPIPDTLRWLKWWWTPRALSGRSGEYNQIKKPASHGEMLAR